MNIYMYVCLCNAFLVSFIYVCYTHACTVYTQVYTYARMYECMYVCIYGCVWMHVCMYLRVIVFLCMNTLVYLYIRMFVCKMTIKHFGLFRYIVDNMYAFHHPHAWIRIRRVTNTDEQSHTSHILQAIRKFVQPHLMRMQHLTHTNTCEWAASLIRTSHVTRGASTTQDTCCVTYLNMIRHTCECATSHICTSHVTHRASTTQDRCRVAYRVATTSRLLKIIPLFCRISSLL